MTLVEMVVVVAIVGVVMSVMLPRLHASSLTQAQMAGMQLLQDLDLARTRALASRSLVRMAFVTTGTQSYTGYLDTDNDGVIGGTAAESQALMAFGTRTLPPGIVFGRGSATAVPDVSASGVVTFANGQADFDSRGLPTPHKTTGAVYLQYSADPAAVVAVSVAASGNLRLWTWLGGTWN